MWVNNKCKDFLDFLDFLTPYKSDVSSDLLVSWIDENSQGFVNWVRHHDLQAPTVITAVFTPGIKIYFNARCEESQQSEAAIR